MCLLELFEIFSIADTRDKYFKDSRTIILARGLQMGCSVLLALLNVRGIFKTRARLFLRGDWEMGCSVLLALLAFKRHEHLFSLHLPSYEMSYSSRDVERRPVLLLSILNKSKFCAQGGR